jgi:hypothetical protein
VNLKWIIHQDQIEEIYLMMIKVIKDSGRKEESGKESDWIDKEYDSIFLEDLSIEIPPIRAVDH